MGMVHRVYECSFGHRWKALVTRGEAPPDECPVCAAIVDATSTIVAIDPPHAPAPARSDTVEAPALRGDRTKAIARFERNAFVRPHFDDGSPLLTNLKDNNREGDVAAVMQTPSTNETMRMTKEMIDNAKRPRETEGGRAMSALGGGWQGVSAEVLASTGGPQNQIGRPVVDLQGKRP